MHDAGARYAGQFRRVVQQRIHEGAGGVAVAGVHDQPGGLVDDDERGILEHDRQGNVLGRVLESQRLRDGTGDLFAAMHLALGIRGVTIEQDHPIFQPSLKATARMLGEQLRQCGVKTQSGAVGRNGYLCDFAIISRLNSGIAHHA